MSSEAYRTREQIVANAKYLLADPTSSGNGCGKHDIDVIVFGASNSFTAAVMVGTTPAIEGPDATTPDLAVRKLLTATCELLNGYMPRIGAHHKNIHGGGVVDLDLIDPVLTEER